MPDLELTLACWDYDRTRPLIDGRVKPRGIKLNVEVLRPRQIFPRMLEHREFEVSELSLASYVSLTGRGDCPFVAIPVALSKIFRHSCIYIRSDAGIKSPQDLKGKRVGTSQYGATAIVFIKGMLQHDHGVSPADIHWFMGGLESPTERPLIPLDLPADVKLDFLNEGETLEAMFEAGGLDALFSIYIPRMFLNRSPRIARLFPDYKSVEKDYYRRTGIFPIMHTVVLRQDVIANIRGPRKVYTMLSWKRATWRSEVSTIPTPCAWPCPGCWIISRRLGTFSARISGPMGSSPTAGRSPRSANMSTNRRCLRAPFRRTSSSRRAWKYDGRIGVSPP